MDSLLIAGLSSPEPVAAPWWLVESLKVFGFTLHVGAMNLWLVALPLAMLLWAVGCENGRRFGRRIVMQMPVIVALGINFGIVPLLFLQLAWAGPFYAATIIMGWTWLAIIALLIPAYYGVYLGSFAARDDQLKADGPGPVTGGNSCESEDDVEAHEMTAVEAYEDRPWLLKYLGKHFRLGGWIGAGLFAAIGLILAGGMTLLEQGERADSLFLANQYQGAATGTAIVFGEVTVWIRWLIMVSLGMLTTAAWSVFDAAWFPAGRPASYRQWARRFAMMMAVVGMALFAGVGSWYTLGQWSVDLRQYMFSGPRTVLTVLTAIAPGAVVGLLLVGRDKVTTSPLWSAAVLAAQIGVLTLNAISRQVVQSYQLVTISGFDRPEVKTDWAPILLFVLTLLIGLATVVWMLAQALRATHPPAAEE